MTEEEIKSRMLLCELREKEYLEVGNFKTANRYHNELLKWENLLNQLNPNLIEERNSYKRGYLNLQQKRLKAIEYIEKSKDLTEYYSEELVRLNELLEILEEMNEN